MAAKILANLLVMGSSIMVRALAQAYRQALANASKTGVAEEAVKNVRKASRAMTEQEARQILGVTEGTAWEDILKEVALMHHIKASYSRICYGYCSGVEKYDTLFERNAQSGSFYIQSKVHRAKECLEATYQGKGQSAPS